MMFVIKIQEDISCLNNITTFLIIVVDSDNEELDDAQMTRHMPPHSPNESDPIS